MTGMSANALFLILLLILPLSALIARRLPLKQVVRMALAWLAIFAVAFLIVAGRHRLSAIWSSISATITGDDQQVVGDHVRIRKSDDGHFWASAEINGVKRRMLIDSGATTTAISLTTARAAKLDLGESPFATILSTANGDIAATRSTVAKLEVGSITARGLSVVVSPSFGDTDVLGMNFLSQLGGWSVEGDTLVLRPSRTSRSN